MSENWPYWQWPYRHHLTLYAEPTNEKNMMKTWDENFKNESKGNDNGIEGKFKLGY